MLKDVQVIRCDVLDKECLISLFERAQPDEVYNLAAISYVPDSWDQAEFAARVTGLSAMHILEAIRLYSGITGSRSPERGQVKFYQASSAQIFGNSSLPRQNEDAPVSPCTPHGSAKAFAHHTTQSYRDNYGMFAVSGILFNHESPRRGVDFVSRKVSLGVARIKLGFERQLRLGRLTATRDRGFAGDYVIAMNMMLAQDQPEDFVIGTGVSHSVEDLVSGAFAAAGLNWRDHVVCDAGLIRPIDPQHLCADPSKAKRRLGWTARVTFDELLRMMVESDIQLLSQQGHGL